MSKILKCSNLLPMGFKEYTAIELRAFYYMVYEYKICVELKKFNKEEEVILDTKKMFCEISNDYMKKFEIMDTFKALRRKGIEIMDGTSYMGINVFSYIHYDEDDGIVSYSIHEDLYELIFDLPNMYTMFEFESLFSMKSKYTQRVYEVLSTLKGMNRKEYNVEEFQDLVGYPTGTRMANVQSRIVIPAINSMKENGYDVKFSTIKKGRNIVKVVFDIKRLI